MQTNITIINPKTLIENVSTKTGVNIKASKKSRTTVLIRQAVYHHLRQRGYSFPEIGSFFGQTHSAIILSLRKNPENNPYMKLVEETSLDLLSGRIS